VKITSPCDPAPSGSLIGKARARGWSRFHATRPYITASSAIQPSRLRPRDALRLGGAGVRTHPLRAVLSALGIALGIGAMVSVVGISASSGAKLQATLDRLGTNLLGEDAKLPKQSVGMVGRIGPVTSVSATGDIEATVRRSDLIPAGETSGIAVRAARTDLIRTVGATIRSGTWLNDATARYPAVVLGAVAAERLGLHAAGPGVQVWLGERWFTVVGILDTVPLAPELDRSALVGFPVAQRLLGFDGHPSTLYERSREDAVEAVRGVLAATANPEHPEEVKVSRPSDALVAAQAADEAFTGLLLGLGAVAVLRLKFIT